jgi:protein-disulfide isomerase
MMDIQSRGGKVLAITRAEPAKLLAFVSQVGLELDFLCDVASPGIAAKFGVLSYTGEVQPTVFVLDDAGVIQRVYAVDEHPQLPNPALVVRSLHNLARIPKPLPLTQDDWRLGADDASLTLIEYSDYQCKSCGIAFRAIEEILEEFGDRLCLVHRHLPLRYSHPQAQLAAESAEAAGAQGKFWEMHKLLFQADGHLNLDDLLRYANKLGLDMDRFRDDLTNRRWKEEVDQDFKAAVLNKIKLPPTLFINGRLYEGPRTTVALREQIERLLNARE